MNKLITIVRGILILWLIGIMNNVAIFMQADWAAADSGDVLRPNENGLNT